MIYSAIIYIALYDLFLALVLKKISNISIHGTFPLRSIPRVRKNVIYGTNYASNISILVLHPGELRTRYVLQMPVGWSGCATRRISLRVVQQKCSGRHVEGIACSTVLRKMGLRLRHSHSRSPRGPVKARLFAPPFFEEGLRNSMPAASLSVFYFSLT